MVLLSQVVIDDFYPDPDEVRRYALSLGYFDAATARDQHYYRGAQSTPFHPYSTMGMDLIVNTLRRSAFWIAPHGDFRLLRRRDPDDPRSRSWVHYDSVATRYSALVFLNPPDQCEGGTSFYRHRELGCERMPAEGSPAGKALLAGSGLANWRELIERLADDGFDPDDKWLLVSTIPMRYNRCVIFDSRQFHARVNGFGDTKETMRLTQNFFFDLDDDDSAMQTNVAIAASRPTTTGRPTVLW